MYDSKTIIAAVRHVLHSKPSSHLQQVARVLHLDRHTLSGVLKAEGLNFRQLRADAIIEAASAFQASLPARSQKEIAYLLGFNCQSALSQFLRRRSAGRPLGTELNVETKLKKTC